MRAFVLKFLAPLFVLGLVLGFFAFKIPTLAPRFSDGHVYSYMGSLIAQGWVPYRDFYYSSPPLLPYLTAALNLIWGPSWRVDLWVPLLCAGLDALILLLFARRAPGGFSGAMAVALLLSSFCLFATSDFATDVHPITVCILLALLLSSRGLFFMAGLVLGLAGLTKIYALVGAFGLLAGLAGLRRWQAVLRVGYGLAATFGLVFLGFYLWLGQPFLDQVIVNNLGRGEGIDKGAIFTFFLKHDPLMVLMFALVPFAFFHPRCKALPFDVRFLSVCMLAALTVFYGFYPDTYYLYFLPGCALLAFWGGIIGGGLNSRVGQILAWILLGASLFYTASRYRSEQRDAAVIVDLPRIVDRVTTITEATDPIYGDSEFTPLVALLSARSIADRLVDTNSKFFKQGIFDFDERLTAVRKAGTRIILTKAIVDEAGMILQGPESVLPREFFKQRCMVDSSWPITHDYSANAILIWRCDPSF